MEEMTKRIEIKLQGFPPKKNGKSSAAGAAEAAELLRQETLKLRNGSPLFCAQVRMHLKVFLPSSDGMRRHGNLDSYVAGIVDVMQDQLIGGEASLISIDAKKIFSQDVKEPFYEVGLEGE